ncbi:4Fe-4S binding protein [Candidatus Bipolaricaulota bacterium]|nr:4Fe-4S binding protein [Candidatus Bipolaricaulota bacterium]
MIEILKARAKQGYRTMSYPNGPAPEMPTRFVGKAVLHPGTCSADCQACVDACPTDAITVKDGSPFLDLGRCVFCRKCQYACPSGSISFSRDFQMAEATREGLILHPGDVASAPLPNLDIKKLFGRSLKLRQVSAGGCNACEADTNVLGTIAWDLGRFGIQFVASPRHADGLLVTGPVTANMELALRKTYAAVSYPKLVIAVGACALSGGLFASHDETHKGVTDILPVDLFIPGCPPHPSTILDGLLQLIGRI